MPDLSHERSLVAETSSPVAGLDEVGRGPWAGPVIACAVLLPDLSHQTGGLPDDLFATLDDSKKLSEAKRDWLAERLPDCVDHAFGEATVEEIDDMNILQASLLAMRRAMSGLTTPPACALVDGNRDPGLGVPTRLVVKGDSASIAIAAASVLAKVKRDRLMKMLAEDHPGYGWDTNMGYGTKAHQAGLESHGVTPHHRKSFAPIKARLQMGLNI